MIELLWTPPDGEPIVGLVSFKDKIIVATSRRLYRVTEDLMVEPIPMTPVAEPEEADKEQP